VPCARLDRVIGEFSHEAAFSTDMTAQPIGPILRPNSDRETSMPSTSKRTRVKPEDAIALLKADHRQVEKWFAEFERTKASSRKAKLALQICEALTIHTALEEEIFYPAFLQATRDREVHHEAVVEHDEAKHLIAQIQKMSPEEDYFDAKVAVLAEMIKHHVKEEERPGGMFADARKSAMDMPELGERIESRKRELQSREKAA
jgi:hemerythrin superfamily protein